MPALQQRIRDVVASLWMWFVLALSMLIFFIPITLWRCLAWPFDPANYFGGRLFRQAGAMAVRASPRWDFHVRGTLPANPRHPYVIVANHESFADMLLLCLLPWEMKYFSKIEIMRWPILGWLMWIAKDVGVRRGRASSIKLAMAAARNRLDGHVSMLIFPEGTRSLTAEMLPFKDGAFRLAIEAGVPILPLAVYGTRNAIAKHDWKINRARAVVEVLAPEPTAGRTVAELKESVRARIGSARDRLRDELAAK